MLKFNTLKQLIKEVHVHSTQAIINYYSWQTMKEIIWNKRKQTLKCHSRFTKNGKVMACKILFSFKVCSTCFNFTTFE